MVKKSKQSIYRKGTRLGQIGFWATVWWGVSWVYILVLFVISLEVYVERSTSSSQGLISDWWVALRHICVRYPFMTLLLTVVIFGWIVGGIIWLRELKKAKVSFKTAVKDLFFTLR